MVFLAVESGPLWAAELSLSDCLKQAESQSLDNIQAVLSEARARAGLGQAESQKYPQLVAAGIYDQSDDYTKQLIDSNKAVIRLEQSLYPFSAGWVQAKQKAAELDVATFLKIETRSDVSLAVKQLYFSILREDDTIKNYDAVEKQLESLKETVIPKYNVGRAPSFDLIKVRTALSDLARARDLARAELLSEKNTMAQVTGLFQSENSGKIDLKPLKNVPAQPASTGTEKNPSLLVASQELKATQFGLSAAKAQRLPLLSAGLEYGYSGQTSTSMTTGWDLTVGLRLPIFDWGTISNQVAEEESNVSLAEKRQEQTQQKITNDLVTTQSISEAHLKDFQRQQALVNEIHQAALISVKRYRQGASGILEVADAVNLWLQTLLNERNAYYAYLSDLARLERLSGKDFVSYE